MAKKKVDTDGKSTFQLSLDKMEKTYGKGSVFKLSGRSNEAYDVISSGSIGMDYITLGVGGWVKGKLYELMGWEGSGKSTLAAHASAECQKAGGKVLYIDGEHALDVNYFTSIGVDMEEMYICQPSSGEEGFNIAREMIGSSEFDLVIIDSDNSLMPLSVIQGEIGDSSIGKKAKLNSDAYPKLKPLVDQTKTCVIVISQYREKIGMMFGDPKTTQGGHALKFYTDCRIEITKTLAKEGTEVYANITSVKTIKNKMFAPYRKTSFNVKFGVGIDKINELLQLMHDYEVGKIYGSSFIYNEEKFKIEDLPEMFESDPDLYTEWYNLLITAIKSDQGKVIIEPE